MASGKQRARKEIVYGTGRNCYDGIRSFPSPCEVGDDPNGRFCSSDHRTFLSNTIHCNLALSASLSG